MFENKFVDLFLKMQGKFFLERFCLVFLFVSFLFLFSVQGVFAAQGDSCSDLGEIDYSEGLYCSVNGIWEDLKDLDSACENNFECVNGECSDGICQNKFAPITERKSFFEEVWNFVRGVKCTPGEDKCEGEKYFYCGENGVWDEGALVDGECGYSPGPGPSSCFPAGTKILMADGTEKNIEDVQVGDNVLTYDYYNHVVTSAKALEMEYPLREGYYNIKLSNNKEVNVTDEHPFYVQRNDKSVGWASLNSAKTKEEVKGHSLEGVEITTLTLKDKLFDVNENWISIESIDYYAGEIQTYNIKHLQTYHTFYANDFLVHNKDGTICTPDWNCTDWSNPSEFCGTRTCVDLEGCGTTRNKPITYKACPGSAAYCGDGNCDVNEDYDSCPEDCQPINTQCNNNGECEPDLGEHSGNCGDCEAKDPSIPSWLFWVLILILISAIAFIVFLIYRKYKKGKQNDSFDMKKFSKDKKTKPGKLEDKDKIKDKKIETKKLSSIPKLDEKPKQESKDKTKDNKKPVQQAKMPMQNLQQKQQPQVNQQMKKMPGMQQPIQRQALSSKPQGVQQGQQRQMPVQQKPKMPFLSRTFNKPKTTQEMKQPQERSFMAKTKPKINEKLVYQTDNVFPLTKTPHERAVSNIASTRSELRDKSEFSLKSYLEKRRKQEVEEEKSKKKTKAKIEKSSKKKPKKKSKKKTSKKTSKRKSSRGKITKITETKTTIKEEISPKKSSKKSKKKSSKKSNKKSKKKSSKKKK